MTQLPQRLGEILDSHHVPIHGHARSALIAEILQAVLADYREHGTTPALADALQDTPSPWRQS